MADVTGANPRARTKIVATVGPACRSVEKLGQLIGAGVSVFRINTAHGDETERTRFLLDIRAAAAMAGCPVGILVDLAGPKIRLGKLHTDPTQCNAGDVFRFIRGDQTSAPDELTSNYAPLISEVSVGDTLMLADGTVSMVVIDKTADQARCRVAQPGIIRSKQGINLPGVKLGVPSLTEADTANAVWAAKNDVDFVSLSFVRSAAHVVQLKELLAEESSRAAVIAKIEKREALAELAAIVHAADGVMVARGDLGVEIDVAETAIVQKRIVRECQQQGKPVIVATQMLDSMHHNRRPTRAEATDVANAILDGADACMLSGETAIGEYPVEAVEMMTRIMLKTEGSGFRVQGAEASGKGLTDGVMADAHPVTYAAVLGGSLIVERLGAKLVIVATRSGVTCRLRSKMRDAVPTIGVSDSPAVLRRLTLFWGVSPLAGAPVHDGPKLREYISEWGRREGLLTKGDRVVFLTGANFYPMAQNIIVIHEVE